MSDKDSVGRRLINGTMVTWVRLAVTILAQIVTTPLYLQFWSAETYGTWLLLIAAIGFLQIPGASYQNFVGFELMKEGARDGKTFSRLLLSTVRFGAVYGLVELTMALALSIWVIPLTIGSGADESLRTEAGHAFLFMALGSGLIWNWGAMWVRAASATGYFARSAWWGVADSFVKVISPLAVIPFGFGMTKAAIVLAFALMILHLFTLRDLRRSVRKKMTAAISPSWSLASACFRQSQGLSAKSGLEMLRQQGIRLVLGPLMGPADLAAFASMRTGANAALQGLATITGPLMPELMRFLAKRDQQRSEAAMATVWMVVVGLMIPAFVVIQLVMESFFHWWTRGKIGFDAPFFACVSTGVLVFAAAQPAAAIVRGNNLVGIQFMNSLVAAVAAVVGSLLLGRWMGMLGVGLALLLSEMISATGFRRAAKRWMVENDLSWPARASGVVTSGVFVAAIVMGLIAFFPKMKLVVASVSIPVFIAVVIFYLRTLPPMAIARIKGVGDRLPITRRLLSRI